MSIELHISVKSLAGLLSVAGCLLQSLGYA